MRRLERSEKRGEAGASRRLMGSHPWGADGTREAGGIINPLQYQRSGTAKKINRGNNRGQGYITLLCLVSSGKLFGARIAAYCKRRDK